MFQSDLSIEIRRLESKIIYEFQGPWKFEFGDEEKRTWKLEERREESWRLVVSSMETGLNSLLPFLFCTETTLQISRVFYPTATSPPHQYPTKIIPKNKKVDVILNNRIVRSGFLMIFITWLSKIHLFDPTKMILNSQE